MIVDCHYCPTRINTLTDEIYFTNSCYGSNHPTCPNCNTQTKDEELIPDYPINNKVLSNDFKNFLLSLQFKNITICLN